MLDNFRSRMAHPRTMGCATLRVGGAPYLIHRGYPRNSQPKHHRRHHADRRAPIPRERLRRTLPKTLVRRTLFPRHQDRTGHGRVAMPDPGHGRKRTGDAHHRLQPHPGHHAASRSRRKQRRPTDKLQRNLPSITRMDGSARPRAHQETTQPPDSPAPRHRPCPSSRKAKQNGATSKKAKTKKLPTPKQTSASIYGDPASEQIRQNPLS